MQRHAQVYPSKKTSRYDVGLVRSDFPILRREINGKPLVYLDNAATSQKPVQVIEALDRFYNQYNANVYRGVYRISEEATVAYEDARRKIAQLINAKDPSEIIFVRGTTKAINLAAHSWGRSNIGLGDGIMLTEMEHRSNIRPWQQLAREKGASLRYVGISEEGQLIQKDIHQHMKEVHLYEATFKDPPFKFEAGTTDIAGAIGLGAAADYLTKLGLRKVRDHDREITKYALEALGEVKGLKMYGPTDPETRGGVVSFNLADVHAHDMASMLDEDGIAVRSGHHCAQPLMERLGVAATTRASVYLYNNEEEIDRLVGSVERAGRVFKI